MDDVDGIACIASGSLTFSNRDKAVTAATKYPPWILTLGGIHRWTRRRRNQGNQQQKDFGNQGNQPNRGQQQQGNQPGHQGQFPNKGQEQPNQPRKENEQQPKR